MFSTGGDFKISLLKPSGTKRKINNRREFFVVVKVRRAVLSGPTSVPWNNPTHWTFNDEATPSWFKSVLLSFPTEKSRPISFDYEKAFILTNSYALPRNAIQLDIFEENYRHSWPHEKQVYYGLKGGLKLFNSAVTQTLKAPPPSKISVQRPSYHPPAIVSDTKDAPLQIFEGYVNDNI